MLPYELELQEADPALIGGAAGAAAVLAAFGRLFMRMRREEAGRLMKLLRREAPAEPAEALREVTRGELDREKKFEEGVRARLSRDLPAAFALKDPLERRARLDQIIDREKRYLEAREEAMTTRALNAVSRFSMKRISPEGAFWTLSPDVKRHTLDCIMLSGKFWPWQVLDELHPPLHPGCACDLVSKREAVTQGLMHEDQVPDTKDAIRRARDLYQWAKSVEHATDREEVEDYLLHLEEADFNPNLHPRDRHGKFRDVPGHLRDLLPELPSTPASRRAQGRGAWRWASGRRVFVPEHRHFERTIGGHTYVSPPDSALLYRDNRLTSDETERLRSGGLVSVGKPNPAVLDMIKQRLPQGETRVEARPPGETPLFNEEPKNWDEFAHDTQGLMEALGRRYNAPVLIGDVVADPKMYDHSGFEDWQGNVYFGGDVRPSVELEARRLASGRKPTDKDLELTYGTFRIQAHEASHGVNPANEHEYSVPGGYTLEEGLTEEAAHLIARENLERLGRYDVIDWADAHPESPHVQGTYLGARESIGKVFDAANVPQRDRNLAVMHLKFETDPSKRVDELVRLSEQYSALTRQEVLDLLSEGREAGGKGSRAPRGADPGVAPRFPEGVKVIYGDGGGRRVLGPFGSWDQVADEVVRLHGEGNTNVELEAGLRGGRRLNAREQAHVVKLATEKLTTGHPDPGVWERVPDAERPAKLYHGTAVKNETGILKRGLTVHKSRKRVKDRDTEPLLFLTSDLAQAEWWARGGPMYEVGLPKDAPLYRDPAFPDAYFTTTNVPVDKLRRVQHQELIDDAVAKRGHADPGVMLPGGARVDYEEKPDYEGEGFTQHSWVVRRDGKEIARLDVNSIGGENIVETVGVDEAYRHRGIASELYRRATEKLGEVQHSEWQTADGLAWSQAVGGKRHGDPKDWTTELADGTRIEGHADPGVSELYYHGTSADSAARIHREGLSRGRVFIATDKMEDATGTDDDEAIVTVKARPKKPVYVTVPVLPPGEAPRSSVDAQAFREVRRALDLKLPPDWREHADSPSEWTVAELRRRGYDAAFVNLPQLREKWVMTWEPSAVEVRPTPDAIDVGDDVNRAADLLAQGKRVELDQPREVSVLLDKLAERVAEAKKLGEKAPVYDLCKVTVKGTNLFCAESKGVPRIKMPQLGGFPVKGSKGDLEAKKEPNGYVDLTAQFHDYLKGQGVKVTDTTEKTEYLRPTQMELNGAKVANILKLVDAGNPPLGWEDRLPVSRDNYILDGHHRWAAQIGEDAEDGKLGDMEVPITRIDMPITELLDAAHKYADDWGLPDVGVDEQHAVTSDVATSHRVGPEDRTAPLPHVKFDDDVTQINDADTANRYLYNKFGIEGHLKSPPLQPYMDMFGTQIEPGELNTYTLRSIVQATKDAVARYPALKTGKHRLEGITLDHAIDSQDRISDKYIDPDVVEGVWATTGPDPRYGPMAWAARSGDPDAGTWISINDYSEALNDDDAKASRNGYLSKAAGSIYGRFMHELGHAVLSASNADDQQYGAEGDGALAIFNKYDVTPDKIAELSEYAASNPSEAWAELFATKNTPGALEVAPPDIQEVLRKLDGVRPTYERSGDGEPVFDEVSDGPKLLIVTGGPLLDQMLAQARANIAAGRWDAPLPEDT